MSGNVLHPLPGPAAERPERETTTRTVVLGLPGIPVTHQAIHAARREGKRVLIVTFAAWDLREDTEKQVGWCVVNRRRDEILGCGWCIDCERELTPVGVQYPYDWPEHYDGVSEWKCPDCGRREGRWSGRKLEDGERERPFAEPVG